MDENRQSPGIIKDENTCELQPKPKDSIVQTNRWKEELYPISINEVSSFDLNTAIKNERHLVDNNVFDVIQNNKENSFQVKETIFVCDVCKKNVCDQFEEICDCNICYFFSLMNGLKFEELYPISVNIIFF